MPGESRQTGTGTSEACSARRGALPLAGDGASGAFVQFDEGELRCPVDRHKHMQLAFFGANLCDVDVKVADRIAFEFPLR